MRKAAAAAAAASRARAGWRRPFFSWGGGGGGGGGGREKDEEAGEDEHAARREDPFGERGEGEEGALVDTVVEAYREQEAARGAPRADSAGVASAAGQAPRMPRLVCIPLPSRPLFPSVPYPLLVKDRRLAKTLLELSRRRLPYVAVFLRCGEKGGEGEDGGGDGDGDSRQGGGGGDKARDGGGGGSEDTPSVGGPDGDARIASADEVHAVGTMAQIWRASPAPDGAVQLVLYGQRRVTMTGLDADGPASVAEVEHRPAETRPRPPRHDRQSKQRGEGEEEGEEEEGGGLRQKQQQLEEDKEEEAAKTLRAYSLELLHTVKELMALNPVFKEQMQFFVANADLDDPARLADMAAVLTTAGGEELQRVLEADDLSERMPLALVLLKKEVELGRLQADIAQEVERKVGGMHRKAMLREQLKAIKRELGMERDDKSLLLQKFAERLEGKTLPDEVRDTIEEQREKLGSLDHTSPEFTVSSNYLDWLTALPWGVYSEENFDLARAERVLAAEHFGMEDVKDRVLEFIACGSMLGRTPQGKIMLLVGPPGVGKTSIGKSVAHALNREFFRFSLGGLSDVAELKGHRRTYIGALPGQATQGLRRAGTSNPVVLLDEVDKMSAGARGDPASALLEMLDPEQNATFMDHFLDVPLDLSKVLFVCTANGTQGIPGPLLDRMEVVELGGYVARDKVEIAKRYLVPKARLQTGVPEERGTLDDGALRHLIRWYCREAGVRRLEQHVEKVFRKVALQLVRGDGDGGGGGGGGEAAAPPVHVTADNLADFVGKPVFTSDRIYDETPPGVVTGLAWNSMGGATLFIESSAFEGAVGGKGGSLRVTGHLGDVMKESSAIAHAVARQHLLRGGDGGAAEFLRDRELHLHVPEGATPKDGPSAGITMATALVSLATGRPLRQNLAMTGEVSLTGKVLRIGGVREKTLAARRARVRELVFPADNRSDVDDLPDHVRDGLTFHFCSHFDEVCGVAFASEGDSSPVK